MKTDYLERQDYPTDMTDKQWAVIEPIFVWMREYKHISSAFHSAQLLSTGALIWSLGQNPWTLGKNDEKKCR